LYIEYRERIYRFCLSRLRSREEAEDAVQNVFMRVHMALDRGVVPQFEAAWLYKIAHNVCLSRAESNSRRTSMEALSSFDDDEFPIAAPELSRDELAGLNEALEAMPHNLRTALLLREWQGLSYAEIADAMDLSVSAVETLIFRARRHLADALEHPGQKRTPVARLLDLLGLGWLRNVLLGVGPAAKLAAGAALLALGGGTAAVALTTDAHSRPAPVQVPLSASDAKFAVSTHALVRRAKVEHAVPSTTALRVSDASGVGHNLVVPVAPAASTPVAGTTTAPVTASAQPAPATPAAAAPRQAPPKTATTPAASVPTVTTTPSVPPTPTVQTPTVPVPTVSAPTVGVPTVSVPTISVPTVSVPTVTLPIGGGGVVGG
jgi:RNA polymerase sigma factor (sigma-70 family)